MACESLAIVSNKSFEKIFPGEWRDLMIFKEKDEDDLARKIIKLISMPPAEKEAIAAKSRELIVENHSLEKLAGRIVESF